MLFSCSGPGCILLGVGMLYGLGSGAAFCSGKSCLALFAPIIFGGQPPRGRAPLFICGLAGIITLLAFPVLVYCFFTCSFGWCNLGLRLCGWYGFCCCACERLFVYCCPVRFYTQVDEDSCKGRVMRVGDGLMMSISEFMPCDNCYREVDMV